MLEKIRELNAARGAKAKQAVLAQYADDVLFRKFLRYALDETLSYNLSSARLGRKDGEVFAPCRTEPNQMLFMYCEYLSSRRGVDDETVREVKTALYSTRMEPEDRELWIGLLSGTLRLGVTARTVNKVIPGLIPVWEVQQAYPIDRYPIPDGTEFWLTQKLNGVRATLFGGELIARSGRPYKGLGHILDAIGKYAEEWGVVFDGELTLKDRGELSDNEAFRVATGILNSDEGDKTAICYTVFDMIPLTDFTSDDPKMCYSVRRSFLDAAAAFLNTDCTRVLPVLYHGTDQSRIWPLLDRMVAEDKVYTVGDRVVAARDIATKTGEIHIGDEGTVCVVIGSSIGVVWDRNVGGHDLYNGLCEKGYGWYMTPHDIQPSCKRAYEAPSASEISALLGIRG